MLIDFADVLQTNVYARWCFFAIVSIVASGAASVDAKAGGSESVHTQVCRQVERDDALHAVVNTALRLVASMKRNWMQTGRRPNGR